MSLSSITTVNSPKKSVILRSLTTSINTIVEDIGQAPETIMKSIHSSGLQPNGPMEFVYLGVENHDKPFTLQIAQPVVDHSSYRGEFEATHLEEFKFYKATYVGSIAQIGTEGWEKLMGELAAQQKIPGPHCRELQTRWEGFESNNNQVELQVEVV
jgi:predicted transcriptional regulator YdeE